MEITSYERFGEKIYSEKLPNGLQIYVLPKPGFQKTYATFSTRFGSTDNEYAVNQGERKRVPDGIAHFLEHKMFEVPGGGDVFAEFASQGASANAFTSFDRTVYLFSATAHIPENITTLLDFVQAPYFTDENVNKEKGIIAQEINMYRDNPDWRSYFGLIEALYQSHPVHIDIAGTVDSIQDITKEWLYDCYNTFYHPSNMVLFVVGGVDPEAVIKLVTDNQNAKTFEPIPQVQLFLEREPVAVRELEQRISLPVSLPKYLFGFKDRYAADWSAEQQMVKECETKLLLDILFGTSSPLYQRLYEAELISDSFGTEYNINPGYAFSVIGGDTKDPQQLLQHIREEVERYKNEGLSDERFERSRRKRIGGFLRMLNSPEALANEYTRYLFKDQSLFEIVTCYEKLEKADLEKRLHEHFDWDTMASSLVSSP